MHETTASEQVQKSMFIFCISHTKKERQAKKSNSFETFRVALKFCIRLRTGMFSAIIK